MTWNQFSHFHRDPQAIALWQSLFGPLLRWLVPVRRRWLLGLGAIIVAFQRPIEIALAEGYGFSIIRERPTVMLIAVMMIAFVIACYLAAQRYSSMPHFIRRRPLMFLHSSFWFLLFALWMARPATPALRNVLAGCAVAMPFVLWRLSYLIQSAQRGRIGGTTLVDHATYIWPVWGGTDTPYGKGLDYLKSIEARDEEELARSQLAGLKLFVLGFLCSVGHKLLSALIFGSDNSYAQALGGRTFGIPTVAALLNTQSGAHAFWVGWVAMYFDLFLQVLALAAYGHVVVGYIRLCGFNVFRNTYKPLLAETIVGFWNRYYYYFKELLVNFFFLPTFARYFKRSPRLRLFAAVFASAFLGNMYYHLIQDGSLRRGDWAELSSMMTPRLGYCFLLALGIYLSMLREQRRTATARSRPWPRRALAILGVWTFFGLIGLWRDPTASAHARMDYLLGLIGLA